MRLLRTQLPVIAIGVCLLAFAGNLVASPVSDEPLVTKVEPPSWWSDHSINPVRLLVRGENLLGGRVRSAHREIIPSNVRINSRGTYLFVNLNIGRFTRPGSYPLVLETSKGSSIIPFRIENPLNTATHFQGITSDDVIYLIMIDRFSNGDSGNDNPPGSEPGAMDRHNPRAYHGGDLRGVINHLPYLKELGVTALWLTPWTDNWNGVNRCDKPWCPGTYYHGYHAVDYYSVEDHFGDLATLRELIEKAHALKIKVIQDQVANHVGSRHPWVKESPLVNWFHGTKQDHIVERFHNSVLLSPHGNPDERRNTLDGWFSEDLPDMNQDEPEVARYEIQNALWWVGVTGIDGIRQDTIQYMPRTFIRDLSNALHRQYSKMWMVGEVFERDPAHTAFFIGGHRGWDGIDTRLDSDFDFSLWSVALDVFTNKRPMRALPEHLKYDALYPDAAKLTTLTNNHDTRRFMSIEGATIKGAMLHTAFALSVRGIPQLYSGEEIAMEGGDDPDNRRDFPGGFPDDQHNAFTLRGRSEDQQRMWEWTRDWISLRREHTALRQGRLIDLYADDDIYAFARQDERETVVIVINRSAQRKITISATALNLREGATLSSPSLAQDTATVMNGAVSVSAPARTAVAYLVR